jgi:tetratricopeptide (TPR) repeat protein
MVLAGMFGGGRLRARWPSPRMGLLMAGLLLLPLTLYAVLAIRSRFAPLLDLGDPETLGRLVAHVSGRQFRYRLAGAEAGYVAEELARFGSTIVREWPFYLLALALLGMIALAREPRRGRRVLAGLALLGGLTAAHAIVYRIPDKEPYFLPLHAVLALFAGAGAGWMVALSGRWAIRRRLPLKPAIAQVVMATALVAMVLSPGIPNLRAADHHADRSLRHLAEEVMRRTPPGSLIIADDTSLAFALLHLGTESGGASTAGDRTVIAQYFLPLPWYQEQVADLAPDLGPTASRLAAARTGLRGRALGDRMAQDARALAAGLARRALDAGRDVFLTFHDFAPERPSFEGLPLLDRGLVYRVEAPEPETAATSSPAAEIPDADFASLPAYTSGRRLTKEERSLAHRFASTANRTGIASVRAGDPARAEREFDKALALDSLYAEAWLNRGLLRADYLRDPAGAESDWSRYLTIAGDARDAAAVRARIATLASTRDSLAVTTDSLRIP